MLFARCLQAFALQPGAGRELTEVAAAAARNVEEVVHTCASRARGGGGAPLPQVVIDGLTGGPCRHASLDRAPSAPPVPQKSSVMQIYLPGHCAGLDSWRLVIILAADSTSCCRYELHALMPLCPLLLGCNRWQSAEVHGSGAEESTLCTCGC